MLNALLTTILGIGLFGSIFVLCDGYKKQKQSLPAKKDPLPWLLPDVVWRASLEAALDNMTLENFGNLPDKVAEGVEYYRPSVPRKSSTVEVVSPFSNISLCSEWDELEERDGTGRVVVSYRVPSGKPIAHRKDCWWSEDGKIFNEVFTCAEHPEMYQTIPRTKEAVGEHEGPTSKVYEYMADVFRCPKCVAIGESLERVG